MPSKNSKNQRGPRRCALRAGGRFFLQEHSCGGGVACSCALADILVVIEHPCLRRATVAPLAHESEAVLALPQLCLRELAIVCGRLQHKADPHVG